MFSSWRTHSSYNSRLIHSLEACSSSARLLIDTCPHNTSVLWTHLYSDISNLVGSPPCHTVRHHQASLNSLTKVTDSDVDVNGNKLQHSVDLVPEVGYSVQW